MNDAATIPNPIVTEHRQSVFRLSDLRFFLRAYAGGVALFLAILS